MFNIGFSELLILALVIIVCIDARKLPEMARVLGRLVGEVKKAISDIKLTEMNTYRNLQDPIITPEQKKEPEPPKLTESKSSPDEKKS